MAHNKKRLKVYLVYHTEFEAFLIMGHSRITLRIVTAKVHDTFRCHCLVPSCHCGHFPDRSGWTGPYPTLADSFCSPFPFSIAIHRHGSKGMNSSNVLPVWQLDISKAAVGIRLRPHGVREGRMEAVGHIVVVRVLPLALHEQSGAFDKLVHWHDDCWIMALLNWSIELTIKTLYTSSLLWHSSSSTF